MTTTDPLTGLPKVPEGYFWEIKNSTLIGVLRLELRKKCLRFFSYRTRFGLLYPPLSPAVIHERGVIVLEEWEQEKSNLAQESESSRYIGKYPPKNLKDASK